MSIFKKLNFLNKIIKFNLNDTPLHIACNNCNNEIIDLLSRKKEINPNIQNEKGLTPLHLACMHDKIEIVKLLLNIPGINCNIKDVLFDFVFYNVLLFFIFF